MAQATKQRVAPSNNQEGLTIEAVTKEDLVLQKLGIELDHTKKYVFELASENPDRELPVIMTIGQQHTVLPKKKFKPFQNLVYTSQIVWNGQRTNLRYYDGCDTIFASDQPKEKESIDQFIRSTKKRHFLDGHFGCYGDEKMLICYLLACSWNVESPFRTRTADAVFVPLIQGRKVAAENDRLDAIEAAIRNAKEASELKMNIHGSYLGIPIIHPVTDNELSPEEYRIEYRKKAMENPAKFNESYGDKTIEVRYYIDKALQSGLIDYRTNGNKAVWRNGSVICDISGFKTTDGVAQKLLELSQLEEGEEFVLQLKALYN